MTVALRTVKKSPYPDYYYYYYYYYYIVCSAVRYEVVLPMHLRCSRRMCLCMWEHQHQALEAMLLVMLFVIFTHMLSGALFSMFFCRFHQF